MYQLVVYVYVCVRSHHTYIYLKSCVHMSMCINRTVTVTVLHHCSTWKYVPGTAYKLIYNRKTKI